MSGTVIEQLDAILRRDGQGLTLGQLRVLDDALSPILARDLAAVQESIIGWQRETFGEDPMVIQATHKKLEQECRELMLALAASAYMPARPVAEELADVLIVALGLAGRLRIDAYAEITAKMEINRRRRWPAQQTPGQPVSHLKETV